MTYPVWAISSSSQTISELLFGGLALVALLYCIRVARRERTLWPLAVFGGSMLLVSYEPFNNFLGHCAYPTPGQHTALSYLGQHVPVSTWFIYMFYFSVAVPFVMQKLEQGITMRTLMKYYVVAVVICGAFEPLFANVHLGVRWWYYYGHNQALDFTGLPMFWWFANAMVVLVTAMIFHLLKRHVLKRDRETLAFIILEPLILFGIHGSAGIPYYIAITSTTGKTWSTIATFGSIAISVMYVWLFGKAVTVPARAPARVTAPVPVQEREPARAPVVVGA
jgi:hypothetical protein